MRDAVSGRYAASLKPELKVVLHMSRADKKMSDTCGPVGPAGPAAGRSGPASGSGAAELCTSFNPLPVFGTKLCDVRFGSLQL